MTDIRDENRTAGNKQVPGGVGFIKAIWEFFSSMKTAISLLLVLAAVSILGTIIPQGGTQQAYEQFFGMKSVGLVLGVKNWVLSLLGAQQIVPSPELIRHYGRGVYRFIHTLALDNVYDSWWYIGLLALVGINLAVCSINRFGATWRRMAHPKVAATEKQISGMQVSEKLSARTPVSETVNCLETALRSSAYHVLKAEDGADAVIYASKGRLSIWGPYLTHVSILVIFLGAIFGSKFGFNGMTLIKEGGFVDSYYLKNTGESKGLGFRVDLRKFAIGYDAGHSPTSYRSDLRVFDQGKQVAQKVIDVNHPMTYKGVTFYQSDFGLDSVILKVTAPNGETKRIKFRVDTQDGPQGRQYSITSESGDMAFDQIVIGGKKLAVFAHDFAPDYVGGETVSMTSLPLNPAVQVMVNDRLPEYKGIDAWTKLGWLAESKPAKFKGFTITLDDAVDYTVLQVARNPGLPVVYTGFGLLLFGVFVSFYITHKSIRIRVSPSKNGASALVGGMSRTDPSVFDTDFARLREALK